MLPHCTRRVNPRGCSVAVRRGTGAHRVVSVAVGLTALRNADTGKNMARGTETRVPTGRHREEG